MSRNVAVVGAGVYGSTIAIYLARAGQAVTLFDPLGVANATTAINQFRVHAGYHYPRSPETIRELIESRDEFMAEYADAIVTDSEHLYAIPHEGSLTSPAVYEAVMRRHGLPFEPVRPSWIDFGFIHSCYRVHEQLYDPDALRALIWSRIRELRITLVERTFEPRMERDFDLVVYATYGASGSHRALPGKVKIQVAEKVLIDIPAVLQKRALVVVDGPFTAFDRYGRSKRALFGSARHTNHWTTSDPDEPAPDRYRLRLNRPAFEPVEFTRFEAMREAAALTTPAIADARYVGSKFTIRVVEDDPQSDRRILHVGQSQDHVFHVFSAKVVSAVKAARDLTRIALAR